MDEDTGRLLTAVLREVLITNQRVNLILDKRKTVCDTD